MPAKPTVLVDPSFRRMDEIFSAADLRRLPEIVDVIWGRSEPMPLEAAVEALTGADAVVCSGWRYGDILSRTQNLRTILTVSGAFPSGLDYGRCFRNGIRVLSAAPAFGRQVAEMALGMAIACARGIVDGHQAMQRGDEEYLHAGNVGAFNLYDKRVGFIGYGGLARSLHPLLRPFGCRVAVYDAWLGDRTLRRHGVTPLPLEELLSTSQVIFVLATPSHENRALLNRALLERIRPDAALILISRAHLVDFEALTDLLQAGRFRAAIDVFPQEPLHPQHPIRSAPNVVLSAHRAGTVQEALWEIGEMVLDDLEAIANGMPPQRMQRAEPELTPRYASTRVQGRKASS